MSTGFGPAAVSTILGLKLIATVWFCVFGLYLYLIVLLHIRHRKAMLAKDEQVIASWRPGALPFVTIQLPVYNEQQVVTELLESITRLDYPHDRFEIHILDDSTDTTTQIALGLVEHYRGQGFDIELLRRPDRSGYKAGNLRAGHDKARGEFIAIFDADFRPPADFLRKTLPFFQDARLACVQTLWGHVNERHSTMTIALGLALDGFNYVVQSAQCWSGLLMHFQGTGGIWRKTAIDDAGGWKFDTLTEDLDLSYQAYLRGWTLKYLPQVVCLGELPETIAAAKAQQHRWTKGGCQVALKALPDIFRSRLPLKVKAETSLYMLSMVLQPCMLAIALCWPAQLGIGASMAPILHAGPAVLLTIGSLGPLIMSLYALRRLHGDWLGRIHHYAYFCLWGMGVSINNTRAIIEALLGIRSGFVRTPRFRSASGAPLAQARADRPRLDWQVAVEAGISIYSLAGCATLALQEHAVFDPFLGLFGLGVGIVAVQNVREALGWDRVADSDTTSPTVPVAPSERASP
jgi:cellulose synthase/poly-beta-1,6-N-acetylglucosamine synthase-like glycosyltransferase